MSTWNLDILYTSLDDPTLQEDFGKLEQMIAENAELAKAPISKENLEKLDIIAQMEEFMFLGLRKIEGVSNTLII